jgi:hypothetical protein
MSELVPEQVWPVRVMCQINDYVPNKPFRRFSMSIDEPRSQHRQSDGRANPSAGDAPVKSATEARQGVTGHNVRYVLALGVLAVIVAFAVVYGYYFHA